MYRNEYIGDLYIECKISSDCNVFEVRNITLQNIFYLIRHVLFVLSLIHIFVG